MYIRSYEEEARQLGFKDEEEMFLYYDVCGFNIIPSFNDNEMSLQCTAENEKLGKTKDEFINYIEENNLVNLFNNVKDLSLLDRLLELYRYNMNGLLITDMFIKYYNKELCNAIELCNGENIKNIQIN